MPNVYRGEALRAVAMPLGGLGTGTIALAGDGSLRQWQIHNQVYHLACVPHSFFAVWARDAWPPQGRVARVLQSPALYDREAASAPPPTSNDHVVPQAHRDLLARLPGVAETEFAGRYPIAEIAYRDRALPVEVTLEAFNPFIPLDAKDSALPAIIFNFTVKNPTDRRLVASVAATLQNAVGWDGLAPITDTRCPAYGGNFNTVARLSGMTAILMGAAHLPEDAPGCGSMALAALAPEATWLSQWENLDDFWADFSSDGRLGNTSDATPSAAGRTWNGALAAPMTLEAGESRTVTFILAWHFPNRHLSRVEGWMGLADTKSKFFLGNQYANHFGSAFDAANYVRTHLDRLAAATRLARDTFYDTTLPAPLIDAVTSQMSILRTPTCFWAEDGRFYGYEGCSGASVGHMEAHGGCCPMNCTHVWNYEMALARLFPALERTMRETEWECQQHPTGYLPHRVVLPLYLKRAWDRPIGGPEKPAIDGLLGAVLKTCREYRAAGDAAWLGRYWPNVKKAVEYVWSGHDPKRSGVIENEQPNTYDVSIWGANTFIGSLYLAALRAAAVMAETVGDVDFAADCRTTAERGGKALDKRLWNGEYYVQDVDLAAHPEQAWAGGCHADQLLGQWWAHVLGLGYVLNPDHVAEAARAIFRHNFRQDFRGFKQAPRAFVTEDDQGLLMCTWPKGGRPATPTLYSDEVWTGIEYEVAGLLLYEGEVDAALRIIETVRARYDGRKQNPWNDIECGDHYVRAMSSWVLLEAAAGFSYDAATHALGFAPVIAPQDFRGPFFVRDGWGTFEQKVSGGAQTAALAPVYGFVELRTLALEPHVKFGHADLRVDGAPAGCEWTEAAGRCSITLGKTLAVRAGQTLRVTLE